MDGLEQFDHTHAIFSGFTSIGKRVFLFCACGVLGQFIGGNIYDVPKFLANVWLYGPTAIAELRPLDLAWVPMEWAGAVLVSAFRLETMLYVPVVALAFLSLMRDDEIKLWPLAVLLVGQPLDAWLVRYLTGGLDGSDLIISLSLLLVYSTLAVCGFYAWWRLREDQFE